MSSGVVELRRYTLHPGARDTLIDLFEREFVETQEALGMHVLGIFRDAGDPDAFVWLRGFRDLAARSPALQSFYTGPVWAEHRQAANATMVASDDVLLLRPLDDASRLDLDLGRLPPVGAPERDASLVVTISPAGSDIRGEALARFVTLHVPNDYLALPVREDVDVVVCLWTAEPDEVPAGTETLRLRPTSRSLLP